MKTWKGTLYSEPTQPAHIPVGSCRETEREIEITLRYIMGQRGLPHKEQGRDQEMEND